MITKNVVITTTNLMALASKLSNSWHIDKHPDARLQTILSKGQRLSALESSALAPKVAIRPNAWDLRNSRRRGALSICSLKRQLINEELTISINKMESQLNCTCFIFLTYMKIVSNESNWPNALVPDRSRSAIWAITLSTWGTAYQDIPRVLHSCIYLDSNLICWDAVSLA